MKNSIKNSEEKKQHLPVKITSDRDGRTASGEIWIIEWDGRERLLRALKICGALWIASIASIVVPILHFVLVPLFFILGPGAAYLVFQQRSKILGGEGSCPQCQVSLRLEGGPLKFPLADLCTHCQTTLSISQKEPS